MIEYEEWARDALAIRDRIESWAAYWEYLIRECEPTEKELKGDIGKLDAIVRECMRLADSIPEVRAPNAT